MKKHCFYHMLCCNDYVYIHNRIFAKIISNSFFDDAQFYFSIVGDDKWNSNLILPKNVLPTIVNDTGSELPAFEQMSKYGSGIADDDFVLYFHCKGASKKSLRDSESYQDTLKSKIAIYNWVDCLSFFMIDHIHEYEHELKKYGTICVYPPRHLFGDGKFAGSLGNFWWCTGNICKSLSKFNYKSSNRHYYETDILGQMIRASDNNYKFGYYVHDGSLHTYTPDSPTLTHLVDGYWNKDLSNLINMDMPYDDDNLSIVLRDKSNSGVRVLLNEQRFKNYKIIPYNNELPNALVYIIINNTNEHKPSYWLDALAKNIKNTYHTKKHMIIDGYDINIR